MDRWEVRNEEGEIERREGEGARKDRAEKKEEDTRDKKRVHAGVCLLLWITLPGTSQAQPGSCWPLAPSPCDTPALQSQAVLGSLGAQTLLVAGQI